MDAPGPVAHDDAARDGNPSGPRGVHGVTMRRVVICSGVLGGGTALVFALAALTATLFPHGSVVPTNPFGWGGRDVVFVEGGVAPAIPVPMPVDLRAPVVVDDFGGFPDPGPANEVAP